MASNCGLNLARGRDRAHGAAEQDQPASWFYSLQSREGQLWRLYAVQVQMGDVTADKALVQSLLS
jgi:hypothetical protein